MLKNVTDIFLQNMEIVFFIYGLSFFTLGLVVLLLTDKTSKYKPTPCLWLLAMFGLLHGANEWLDMFVLYTPFNYFLMTTSFLFLLAFSIQALMIIKKKLISCLNKIVLVICLSLLLVLLIHDTIFIKMATILSRYFIGFPGAFLTGLAFLLWRNQAEIKKLGSKIINISFVGIGISFILYAIFTGLIVSKASFFPASIVNYPNFIKAFGFPVQIMRTLCALIISICIFGVLKIFYYKEKGDLVGQAHHDSLTKLYNRQTFDEIYLKECERSKRYQKPLSVLFVDVDNFKAYNDNYGHMAGDDLLKRLANLMLSQTRSADYVFRYGGEEFVILLPEIDTQASVATAERIRVAFKKKNETISIGVATFMPSTKDPFEVINLADKAMYQAKQTGKNKVCVIRD